MRIFIIASLLLISNLCLGQTQQFNISDTLRKVTIQLGVFGVIDTPFEFSDINNPSRTNGNYEEISVYFDLKSRNNFSVFCGAGFTRSDFRYRYYAPYSFDFDFYTQIKTISLAPTIGVRSYANMKSMRVFSNLMLELKATTITEFNSNYSIQPITREPALSTFRFAYRMQLGMENIGKKSRSISLLATAGRSINSYASKEGIFAPQIPNQKITPWEFGLMIGFKLPHWKNKN